MYPVVTDPQSRVLGWNGDNVLYTYMTGWMADSLLEGQSPFIDPHANYPDSLSLATNEAPFLSMFLVVPLTWLFGPVFGYNTIMLVSAFLSGLCMYLWVYRITGSRVGGAIAGIIFILTPYRVVRSYGHLNLISIQVLPLFFWALDMILRSPRPTWRQLVAAGGAVFLVGAMSQYYLVICLLTGLAYFIFGLVTHWKDYQEPKVSSARPGMRDAIGRIVARRGEWIIAGAGLMLALVILTRAAPAGRGAHQFDMAGRTMGPLRGSVSDAEVMESTGRIFRWTMGPVEIAIPDAGGEAWVAQMDVSTRHPDGSPTHASIHFEDGNQVILPDSDLRSIHMLVPGTGGAGTDLKFTLRSDLYREQSSSGRSLGVGIFAVAVQPVKDQQTLTSAKLALLLLIALGSALFLRLWPLAWRWVLVGSLLVAASVFGVAASLGQLTLFWLMVVATVAWGSIAMTLLVRVVRSLPLAQSGLKYLISTGLGAGLSALPYILTNLRGKTYKAYLIEETRWSSASPENYLVPSNLHPLWGGWIERNISLTNRLEGGWIEHTAYLGLVGLILAGIALVWRRTPYRRHMTIWIGTILVALVFSFGTDLHLSGRPVSATDPQWLPMYYIGQLPVVSLMRVWTRFSIVVIVLVTAMAGVGAAQLYRYLQHRRWYAGAMAVAVALLVMLDLAPGHLQSTVLAPRPIDLWLAAQPGDFAAAFLPEKVEPFPALFGTLTHGKSITAYNHDQHRPAAYNAFARRASTFPDATSLQLLQDLKLRYLLINLNKYNPTQRDLINQELTTTSYGALVTRVNEWLIFEFKSQQ
jgi:hypothetical protein